MVLQEVFEFCPEIKERFIPFVSVDPGREVDAQIKKLIELNERFPIYGLKIVPVSCQTKITELLDSGKGIVELACERNWPILIHTTVHAEEEYS
ncbi:hypothetical protein LCGC14_0937630, partial [marine sediment metagenome]